MGYLSLSKRVDHITTLYIADNGEGFLLHLILMCKNFYLSWNHNSVILINLLFRAPFQHKCLFSMYNKYLFCRQRSVNSDNMLLHCL